MIFTPPTLGKFAPLLLILAVALVYGQVGGFDFVNWDDDLFVYKEAMLQQGWQEGSWAWVWAVPERAFLSPLSRLSYLLDVTWFGLHPAPMHLVNVVFHGANVLLLFHMLLRLTLPLGHSLLAALLFAVHPQHVEAVAWIAERKEVMSFFFGMLAIHGYLIALQRHGRPAGSFFWASVACLLLSLLTKPLWVTLPLLFLLLDHWPLSRSLPIARLVGEKWPYWLLVTLFSLLTMVTYGLQENLTTLGQVSLDQRLQNALVAYGLFIKKTLLPVDLAPLYPLPVAGYDPSLVWLSATVLLTITLVVASQKKHHPALAVGWLWFLGTLFPVSGLVNAGQVVAMADRWSYLPHVGVLIALVGGLPSRLPSWLKSGAALLLLVCTAMAWQQTTHWQSSKTLWLATLQVTPAADAAMVHLLLGLHYQETGHGEGALTQLQLAYQKDSQDPFIILALANLYESHHNQPQADILRQKLLLLPATAPQALFVIAIDYFKQGKYSASRAFFSKTGENTHHSTASLRQESLFFVGLSHWMQGEREKAHPYWQSYLLAIPQQKQQRCTTARRLLQQNEFNHLAGAIAQVQEICQ